VSGREIARGAHAVGRRSAEAGRSRHALHAATLREVASRPSPFLTAPGIGVRNPDSAIARKSAPPSPLRAGPGRLRARARGDERRQLVELPYPIRLYRPAPRRGSAAAKTRRRRRPSVRRNNGPPPHRDGIRSGAPSRRASHSPRGRFPHASTRDPGLPTHQERIRSGYETATPSALRSALPSASVVRNGTG
jgi:hypothetical protein